MLKQAYRHKNQQPPLVPWLTPGASLIATSAFVLFVAGFIVAALMLVAVSALICIFYFASWYVFNDIVPSNRALWVRVLSLVHIAFEQLQQFTDWHHLYVFQNQEYFLTQAGPTSGFRTLWAQGDSCIQLWREREITYCLHNSVQGDLKGRCEHRDRVMRKSRLIYPNIKRRNVFWYNLFFSPETFYDLGIYSGVSGGRRLK